MEHCTTEEYTLFHENLDFTYSIYKYEFYHYRRMKIGIVYYKLNKLITKARSNIFY